MSILSTLAAFAALVALAVFFAGRAGAPPGVAPLLAVAACMLWHTLAGVAGLLVPAGWVFFIACFGLGAWAVVTKGPRALAKTLAEPGFLFFLGLSLAALLLLALRQPLFSQWDEFSSWGTFAKMTHQNGKLYPLVENGFEWTPTELPGLVVLTWFVQLMGSFAPWRCYFAYNLALFAAFAAVLAPLAKRRAAAVGLGLSLALLPFFFLSPLRDTALVPAYISVYNDLPAGILFGGTVAAGFALRETGGRRAFLALLPLAALALIKDNTFPIALVAAGISAADALLFSPRPAGRRPLAAHWLYAAACFAATAAPYLIWKRFAAFANAQNAVSAGAATGADPGASLVRALGELSGLRPRSEALLSTLGEMWATFRSGQALPVSMLGGGLATVLAILALFALAILLGAGRRQRLRTGLLALLSLGGFLGFQLVLLTFFAFMSKESGSLPEYGRYNLSYLGGWLILALWSLAVAAAGERPKRALAAQGAGLAAAVYLALLFSTHVLPGWTLLDASPALWSDLRAEQSRAETLSAAMEPGSRAFFITSDDTGMRWFRYHHYMQPRVLDYSFGGRSLGPPHDNPEKDHAFYEAITAEELSEYLQSHNCEYILLHTVNRRIRRTYKSLFADELAAWQGQPMLYRRGENGLYEPVPV